MSLCSICKCSEITLFFLFCLLALYSSISDMDASQLVEDGYYSAPKMMDKVRNTGVNGCNDKLIRPHQFHGLHFTLVNK